MAKNNENSIPVIDLFAGPGGLGEGFCSIRRLDGSRRFRIALSIEKDEYAHRTLQVRAFFRQFPRDEIPPDYYAFLRGEISLSRLFDLYPEQSWRTSEVALHAELGRRGRARDEIHAHINRAIRGGTAWVLIGGPPCQAYSLAGRSRNKGIEAYQPSKDRRHFLYREYLRTIARYWPAAFIMENVKGLLSARINEKNILDRMLRDLKCPAEAINQQKSPLHGYHLYSLIVPSMFDDVERDPREFVIPFEDYGIPQARHRLIILGIRDDLNVKPNLLTPKPRTSAEVVLNGLPKLRSGLSRQEDSDEAWMRAVRAVADQAWFAAARTRPGSEVLNRMVVVLENLKVPESGRGAEFIRCRADVTDANELSKWYLDRKIGGVCNHATRTHMVSDLWRYVYAACFAELKGHSPKLGEFPSQLLPAHDNVSRALIGGNFADRFRVQVGTRPATTITSHIAKDGHYYIHPDPAQCRSLTVREAARLQTFPDNYVFMGPRTEQYHQVGNAVPPFLAKQIAEVVLDVLQKAGETD